MTDSDESDDIDALIALEEAGRADEAPRKRARLDDSPRHLASSEGEESSASGVAALPCNDAEQVTQSGPAVMQSLSGRAGGEEEQATTQEEPALTQDAELAPKQQRAYEAALGGSNVFITGGPGTGKSFTLRKIIAALEDQNGHGSVLVWAPTGVAAILVEGQTMHSKPGPGVPDTSGGFENVWGSKGYWRSVRTLVLDEVSMADAEFIDWVEANVRAIIAAEGKEHDPWVSASRPFGGLQLIFCGDFAQLPPVPRSDVSLRNPGLLADYRRVNQTRETPVLPVGAAECKGKWCFQTGCWRDAEFEAVELEKSFRTGDPLLINALHELRRGHATHPAVMQLVAATQRPLPVRSDGIKPTVLYPIKRAVEQENREELAKLDKATEHVYKAKDGVEPDHTAVPPPDPNPDITPNERKKFGENCPAAEEIRLRLGAQVMLLKNEVISLPEGEDTPAARRAAHRSRLVNGSRGVVIGFRRKRPEDLPANESKSRGVGGSASGGGYVAGDGGDGRVGNDGGFEDGDAAGGGGGGGGGSSSSDLPADWTTAVDEKSGHTYYYRASCPSDVRCQPPTGDAVEDSTEYPEVRFANGRTKLILPEDFRQKLYRRGTCKRSQLPLGLAWALTIHKGQGQSLDYVIVDLRSCFAEGQAYVAISRAKSTDGLQIRNYSPAVVKVSEAVELFYRHLHAGTLPAHLEGNVVLWWHVILEKSIEPGWAELYRKHPFFRRWELEHPPSTGGGPSAPRALPPGPPPGPPPASQPTTAPTPQPSQPSRPLQLRAAQTWGPSPQPQAPPKHNALPTQQPLQPTQQLYPPPPLAHCSPPTAAAAAPQPVPRAAGVEPLTMCVKGCLPCRRAKPGEHRPGRPWNTCCRECATGKGYHSQECEQRFAHDAQHRGV